MPEPKPEVYIDRLSNGAEWPRPGTRWRNNTSQIVTMDLSEPAGADPSDSRKFYPGRTRIVRIQPGEEVILASDWDWAIQSTVCTEPTCKSINRMYCRDNTHRVQVLGGLGPQLQRMGTPRRSEIHPALITEPTRISYTTHGVPVQQTSLPSGNADARLMARSRASKGAGQ